MFAFLLLHYIALGNGFDIKTYADVGTLSILLMRVTHLSVSFRASGSSIFFKLYSIEADTNFFCENVFS